MAWYTEQIFADFLNCNNNHNGAKKALLSIIDENTVLNYGRTAYRGPNEIIECLDQVYNAISSDQGFTAKPVITEDTNGNRKKAVALFSKLEEYVSWLFRICASIETWKITRIDAERPAGYDLFYDSYTEGEYNDDGTMIAEEHY